MKNLHTSTVTSIDTSRTSRHTSLFITLSLIIPLFSGLLILSTDESVSSGEIGSEDLLHWPQFQKTEQRDATYHNELRGINDPVIKWDLDMNVLSMGTTAADFRKNGLEDDGYNRDVVHLLFCAENPDGNTTIFIVDGDTGESAWELDMGDKTIEAGPVVGYLNDNDRLDIVFASSDGFVYAYEPNINFDPEQGEGDRYKWEEFNVEEDKLWVYETDDEILDVSPLLTDLTPDSGDDTLDVVIAVRLPDSDTHSKVYGLDGDTRDSSGSKIWEKELEGELPSSPSSLVDGGDNYIWIACYSDDDQKEYLYALKGKNGIIWKTITEKATRGYWDLFIPSPVISDIDGDDKLDIVLAVPMDPTNIDDYGTIYVYNLFGEPLNEWKYGVSVKGRIGATPVVGDLKGDGKQYIVVQAWYFSGTTDASTVVTALKRDGIKLWSQEFNTDSQTFEDRAVSSPVLFDLDQNGGMDVIAATNPRVYAFDGATRDFMEGFSPGKKLDDDFHQLYDSPAIGDFNNDGIFDIAIDSVLITLEIAELEVGEISFSNKSPEGGEEIDIRTEVFNNGTADTGNVVIRFMDENTTIMEDTHTIPAGGTADNPKPRVEGYKLTEGWHTFTVIVDPDNEIEEVNKTNNVLTKRLFVASAYDYKVTTGNTEKSALPKQTISFQLQIENTGTKEDSYTFEGIGLPDLWNFDITGDLEGDESMRLASRDTGNVSVNVHIPDGADAHTRETLTFNISSAHISKMVQYNFSVLVEQDNDVKFEIIGDSVRRVIPGSEVTFRLRITNTGNGMDNYTLSRETPPDDWDAIFNIVNLNKVAATRPREATITLTAPEISELTDQNQEAVLTLTVTSKDNSSAEETVEIKAEISQLAVDPDYIAAFPGENATYTIEIFNKDEDENNVTLKKKLGSGEWDHEFEQSSFRVLGRTKVEILLNVTVPDNADPESVNTLNFEVDFKEQDTKEEETVQTEARQKHEVEITSLTNTSGGNITADDLRPGESRDYLLTFRNKGNWFDSYEFSAQLPDGWTAEFDPTEILDIERNSSQTITVTLTTSEQEWAFSDHDIVFMVNSTENDSAPASDSVELKITILKTRDVELKVNGSSFSILPSQTITLNFSVSNQGNWFENFTQDLTIPQNMENYTIEFDDQPHPYSPFQESFFAITIESPGPLDEQVVAGLLLLLNISTSSEDVVVSNGKDIPITVDQHYEAQISDSLSGNIRPSEEKDLDVTLTNLGNGKDTFTVSGLTNDFEWRIALLNGSGEIDSFLIELGPGESWDFIFRLEAPNVTSEQAKAGYTSVSAVGAVSESGLATYQTLDTVVDQVYATSIEVNKNDQRVIPEETVKYELTILNIGNGDESIDITTDDPETYWGLLLIGGRSFTLGYGETAKRTLEITAPDTDNNPLFGDTSSINVTAVTAEPENSGKVTVTTIISYFMPVEDRYLITPDTTKDIPIYIMDAEGEGKNLYMETGTQSPWKVRFKTGGISTIESLTSYERKTIYLTVTSPSVEDTLAGETMPVWVQLSDPQDNISVNMVVKAVYAFNGSAVAETMHDEQGSLMNFSFDLSNMGNEVDIYTFLFSLPEDDWIGEFTGLDTFQEENELRHFVSLEPRDSTRFHLEIQLPEYVLSRSYSVLISIASDHGEKMLIYVNAVIDPYYEIEIVPEKISYNANDGQDLNIDIEFRNLGNSQENLSLFVKDLPLGWSALFSPSSVKFPAQTTKEVTLTLSIPIGYNTNDEYLTIEGRSDSTGSSTEESITVKVTLQDKPDLTITSITMDKDDPEEGDTVTLTVIVANIGNAVARDVVVQFFQNDELFGEESISTISSSKTSQVTKSWKPNEGNYILKVIVDPANDISEVDETNNEETTTQRVTEAPSSFNTGIVVIILVIVLVAVGVVIVKPGDREKEKRRPVKQRAAGRETKGRFTESEIDYSAEKKKVVEKHQKEMHDWGDEVADDQGEEQPKKKSKSKPKITMEEEIFPIILNCPNCRKKIRIVKDGKFRCPNCSHIGRVDETGELVKGSGPKISTSNWDDDEDKNSGNERKGKEKLKEGATSSKSSSTIIRTKDSLFPMKYKCQDCGKKSTVEKSGWYKCPFCGSIHQVDDEGGIDNIQDKRRKRGGKEGGDGLSGRMARSSNIPRRSERSTSFDTDLDWPDDDGTDDQDVDDDKYREGDENTGYEEHEDNEYNANRDDNDDLDTLAPGKVTSFPAVVACPSCEARFRVKKKGTYRCQNCSEKFPVGTPSAITSHCPWCSTQVKVKKAGNFTCPSCGKRFELEKDGTSVIELARGTKKEWKENKDTQVSLGSMWNILHKFIPDLDKDEVSDLYRNGFKTLNDLKGAEEIDLAISGLDTDKARLLKNELKKF